MGNCVAVGVIDMGDNKVGVVVAGSAITVEEEKSGDCVESCAGVITTRVLVGSSTDAGGLVGAGLQATKVNNSP